MGGVKVGGPATAVTLTGGDSCLPASRRITGVDVPPSPTGFVCWEPSATGHTAAAAGSLVRGGGAYHPLNEC